MATAIGKTRCVICGKEKATIKCEGCSQDFCYKHLGDHRQDLNKELDKIEINGARIRQSLTQQIEQPNNHSLIQEIDNWERNSIKIIQQTAEEARKACLKNTNKSIHQIESKLNKLTNQLGITRDEDDFNEIHLRQFQEELDKLANELIKPSNISIREDSTSFIKKISIHVSDNDVNLIPNESTLKPNIHQKTRWIQNGVTVAGGNGEGNKLNQLDYPFGIYINDDQSVYVADMRNHRIMKWKHGETNGQVVAGGNGKGTQMNQLDSPIDVIIDKERNNLFICDLDNRRVVRWPRQNGTTGQTIISNIDCCRLITDNNGYLYVSDYKKHEVRRWKVGDTSGILVAGGNERGNDLNQLNHPTFIFVDEDHSVYVSDHNNHRVMKWVKGAKEGIIVAGGRGIGNALTQLSGPQGLTVDSFGTVCVADRANNRIMRWYKGATQGTVVIGENGAGQQANQLNNPIGLSFDRQRYLYVVDCWNNRVQRFNIDRS